MSTSMDDPGSGRAVAAFAAHRLNNLMTILLDLNYRLDEEHSLTDQDVPADFQLLAGEMKRLSRLMRHASGARMAVGRARLRRALDEFVAADELDYQGVEEVRGAPEPLADFLSELVKAHSRGGQGRVTLVVSESPSGFLLDFRGNPQRPGSERANWLRALSVAVADGHGGGVVWSEDNANLQLTFPGQ
jgi:hypothetical protein